MTSEQTAHVMRTISYGTAAHPHTRNYNGQTVEIYHDGQSWVAQVGGNRRAYKSLGRAWRYGISLAA